MQSSIAGDPVKWEDVVINDSDDDEMIYGESASLLKISKGYHDPLGIVTDLVDPQTDELSYSSELFNPMKYLLEIHNNTGLESLRIGLHMMNETTLDEEARLKTLVKDYFGEFVTARKTIEELDGTLSDNKFFTKDGGLVLEGLVNETEELTEELIAPLQQNREKMYALQNSLPLFMQHRATYPTIDNMERYLQNKQWDGFLKEYTNFQNTLQHSEESNVMIDFIKAHIMEYVQKAIDEILSILYNSGDSLSPEKQSSYINIVIGLGYSHVPELFMLQNSLQGYKNAISGCRERLRKWAAWVWSHEKRVRAGRNRFGPRNGGEKRVVALFAGEAAAGVRGGTDETARGRDPKGEERVRVQSMLRRVEDLVSVNESINKMLELLHELLKCFQSEVKWVLEKGMNTASMDTLYFSSDDVLALYDLVHLNMRQMCEASFGALARSAAKSNKTTLQQTLEAVQNVFVEMHTNTEMEVVASYIKLSFASIHLVLSGVPVDQLLLSPFVITQQMLHASGAASSEPTLLSFRAQITHCCDGIQRHLSEFEETLSPIVMKYLAEALLAVIQGVKAAVVDPSHVELSRLLDCVYTLSYVNDRLIKEPLAKYAFIRKDAQLNEAYKLCTSTIKQYTQSYLQRSLEGLLRALHECFDVDWVAYRTLQPMRVEVADFLTRLALVSGDLTLYVGIDAKQAIGKLVAAALEKMVDIFQGLRDITEPAYCQLLIEVSVMEKALPSPMFSTLRTLLEKGFRGVITEETKVVVDKYVSEAYEKMKRIIEPLN